MSDFPVLKEGAEESMLEAGRKLLRDTIQVELDWIKIVRITLAKGYAQIDFDSNVAKFTFHLGEDPDAKDEDEDEDEDEGGYQNEASFFDEEGEA